MPLTGMKTASNHAVRAFQCETTYASHGDENLSASPPGDVSRETTYASHGDENGERGELLEVDCGNNLCLSRG